jgi:hypothetical protein
MMMTAEIGREIERRGKKQSHFDDDAGNRWVKARLKSKQGSSDWPSPRR